MKSKVSVYSEEDNHLIDEDNASGGPTFINLRHAVDITDEYRTHHAPRSTIIGPYQGLYGRNFLIAYFKDRGITDDEIEWYARWGGLPYFRRKSAMNDKRRGTVCCLG